MSYAALEKRHRRLFHLAHAEAMLGWDEAAMMPPGGGEARAEALSTLRGLIHAEATDPSFAELFDAAEREQTRGDLSEWQVANLREMKREFVRQRAIPKDLVEAASLAESRSEQAWRRLRALNDWDTYRPFLEEVVSLKRLTAQALAENLGDDPYDCLLDGFEPAARSGDIARSFDELGKFLPAFIQAVLEKQRSEELVVPSGPFPIEQQKRLGVTLMQRAGFDFERGRLDVSHHPFCGGVPEDVRITTRYDETSFVAALMGVMHETGHAKYEQNLPRPWMTQPVGRARGMAMHESQSLLLEMQVCRSREFLEFARPLIAEGFPAASARESVAFTTDNLHRLYTRVKPDFIRVDADEATYPCHVILRFEIERPLVLGKLRVEDIPEVWDARMRELLGISTAGDYRNGCMQDVHWPAGLFGYFPTYTLGALAAAQLYAAARRDVPELGRSIAVGEFTPLDAWLREHVWSLGSSLDTNTLIERATGAPLGTAAFMKHLKTRYLNEQE